jgi:hypothetical protein
VCMESRASKTARLISYCQLRNGSQRKAYRQPRPMSRLGGESARNHRMAVFWHDLLCPPPDRASEK